MGGLFGVLAGNMSSEALDVNATIFLSVSHRKDAQTKHY